MGNTIAQIAGILLLFLLIAVSLVELIKALRRHLQSKRAVDRTLAEVPKGDWPALFHSQSLGYVLFILATAFIGFVFLQGIWRALRGE